MKTPKDYPKLSARTSKAMEARLKALQEKGLTIGEIINASLAAHMPAIEARVFKKVAS